MAKQESKPITNLSNDIHSRSLKVRLHDERTTEFLKEAVDSLDGWSWTIVPSMDTTRDHMTLHTESSCPAMYTECRLEEQAW